MMIAYADTETHQAPPGWAFLSDVPEDCPEYDAEVWYLGRVG
jgi:hypothetical protein